MTTSAKWKCLLVSMSLFPLLAWGCATDFRDALLSGALDYVSGTMTDALSALLPIADTLGAG